MSQADRIARICIELDDTDPTIWRSVEVPLATSLKGLHEVIQAAMPFEDYHLFHFEVGDKRYGIPDPEWDDVRQTFDAKNIKLAVLVDRGVGRFAYTYDFGDNWQHTVTIETTIAADPAVTYPRFIDGARRAPPEDVGGIPGFEEFLDVMAKPRHRERASANLPRAVLSARPDTPSGEAPVAKGPSPSGYRVSAFCRVAARQHLLA